MQKLKYFISFLFIFLMSFQDAMSLEREYFAEEYCSEHQQPTVTFNQIQQYTSLIPGSGQCLHVHCSKCQNAWVEYKFYEDESDEEEWTEIYWNCKCKQKLISKSFKNYWDYWMPSWVQCENGCIYDGYFSQDYAKYTSFFYEYLQYVNQNQICSCFWPEISKKAASISDIAYNLFREIFENTDLRQLIKDPELQKVFFLSSPLKKYNLHGATIFFVCHSFFYSDYDWICRDIEFFSNSHFHENSAVQIKNNLNEIKEILALLFLDVYTECLKNHPHARIEHELCLVRSYLNLPLFEMHSNTSTSNYITNKAAFYQNQQSWQKNNFSLVNDRNKIYSLTNKCNQTSEKSDNLNLLSLEQSYRPNNWQQSDVFLSHGTLFNDINLYNEAILTLTQSVKLNPANRDAYIERAMAYFETNQFYLAIEDFESAKKLTFAPPFKIDCFSTIKISSIYCPDNKIDFSNGLITGTMRGAKLSATEFIPSIYSSFRGILNGLWSFTCSPIEVSKEMINTAYAIGEFISNNSAEECLQCVVPELKELSFTWNKLNDYSRGQKIGFIIGKYGVDIFAPFGVLKGANKVRALKRANIMCTLESCATSHVKQTKILEESSKRAFFRDGLIVEASKNEKILVKSSNVQYHIMQNKHAWDKVISLSGNLEADFSEIILLLEKNKLTESMCLVGKPELFPTNAPKISKSIFEKNINGYKIHAEFETYLDTGLTFIKDAWVIQ